MIKFLAFQSNGSRIPRQLVLVSAVVTGATIALAPQAAASPELGQPCIHAEFNNTTVTPDGTALRCGYGEGGRYAWVVDQGPLVDKAIEGQLAWTNCMEHGHTPAQCRTIVDGAPAPATIPGDGTFMVGTDFPPGLYRSSGGVGDYSCVWFRHATPEASAYDIIKSGSSTGQQYAMIAATDAMFETSNCNTWELFQ